jgi:hypothetical protein
VKELKRKYLKLLKIELEDLAEDLEIILEMNSRKKDKGEITNYVYMENVSLLQHEIACLDDFMTYCETLAKEQPAGLASLEELASYFCRCLAERARKSDYPQAVMQLVEKRMSKIVRYMAAE